MGLESQQNINYGYGAGAGRATQMGQEIAPGKHGGPGTPGVSNAKYDKTRQAQARKSLQQRRVEVEQTEKTYRA